MKSPSPRQGAPNHDLLRARMEKHLSREELARRSKVSSKAIRDIEKGRVTNPHMETCTRLSKALNRDILDLFPLERDAV